MASRRHHRTRACRTKRRYPTYAQAEHAAQQLQYTQHKFARLNIYACRFCSSYHAGHLHAARQW
jgi:hypothetical protein